jgi:hypothetical protein
VLPSSIARLAHRWDLVPVAEDLERWTERTPERHHLFGRVPTFGAAAEAARVEEGAGPPPPAPPPRTAPRERGPFVTYMRMPWSYGDRGERDFWHRIQCRVGRHEITGGHPMQLAGNVVFIERSCRWCGVEPA